MHRLPHDTVLLVIGFQRAIEDLPVGERAHVAADSHIPALVAAWREAGMPIVHGRRDLGDADSPYRPGAPGHAFKPEATPTAGETVIGVGGRSAFDGSDFESVLEQRGATTLVVCGALVPVAATARRACELGYRVFFPLDACWLEKRDIGEKRPDFTIGEAYETDTPELIESAALAGAIRAMRARKAQ